MAAYIGGEECHIAAVVLEKVFCEDGRAGRLTEHEKVSFHVAVAVGLIHAERHLFLGVVATALAFIDDIDIRAQVGDSSIVEAFSEAVGLGSARSGVAAPATRAMPFAVIASAIDVNRDIKTVVFAILLTDFVDLLTAVVQFSSLFAILITETFSSIRPGLQWLQRCIVGEACIAIGTFHNRFDVSDKFARIDRLTESTVRRAFAWGAVKVSGTEDDYFFH